MALRQGRADSGAVAMRGISLVCDQDAFESGATRTHSEAIHVLPHGICSISMSAYFDCML